MAYRLQFFDDVTFQHFVESFKREYGEVGVMNEVLRTITLDREEYEACEGLGSFVHDYGGAIMHSKGI